MQDKQLNNQIVRILMSATLGAMSKIPANPSPMTFSLEARDLQLALAGSRAACSSF